MLDQNIPGILQNRVMNFYEFIWNKNKWVNLSSIIVFWDTNN